MLPLPVRCQAVHLLTATTTDLWQCKATTHLDLWRARHSKRYGALTSQI